MKKFFTALTIIFSVVFFSFKLKDDPGKNNSDTGLPYQIAIVDSKKMDGNNISTWYRNNGSFNRDPSTGNSGFEWPKGTAKFARYASGLWMGGIVGNDTLVAIAEYDYEYLPGYIDNSGNPQGKDDPNYKIYKINKGDTTSFDYLNWPVNQGAYADSNGKPFLIGNQTMFYSYTDGYPEAHANNAGNTRPLKAQIQQTNWCFMGQYGIFNDIIFTEYKIINRSNLPWTKFYIALWTDDDLGDANDDAVGCDTNLNLGFTYNFDNNDPDYGTNPPAVGFVYLRGPFIQSSNDTVRYFNPPGSNNLIVKPGYKSLNISSFNMYTGGDPNVGDPSNYRESYLNLQGFRRNGTPWINPQTNQVTKFAFTGDPETNTGWLELSSGDRRFLLTLGPLTINPGDTQTIVAAQLIARGLNNTNSVSLLKTRARLAKLLLESNFNAAIQVTPPKVSSYAPGNGKIYLSWNDSAERISYRNILSGGTYKFQGYNIYQIRFNVNNPSSNDTVLIKTFDIKDGIKSILDSVYLNQYEGIVYGIVQRGSDNGISRFLVVDKDTLSGLNFINGTEYKFAVTAYYYDPSGGLFTLPKVLESDKQNSLVRVIPQSLTPGTQVSYSFGDTIRTDQRDLAVMPIVFDPTGITSATYTSTFGGTDNDVTWTLSKTLNGITSVLFQEIHDFSGTQDTAKIIDGFLMVHQMVRDSGVVRDPENRDLDTSKNKFYTNRRSWSYEPDGKEWFTGPDTIAIRTAKTISGRQFESRSLGMSFPTIGNFKNSRSRISANGKFFQPGTGSNTLLTGGPLRKVQIVFGQSTMAYRFVPTDTNLNNTPYADMVSIPFSVFAVDELDSSGGAPRQLNVGFMDRDNDGLWNPDTSKLGNYHFTYIFASDYSANPNSQYTTRNPGLSNPTPGFPSMDIMYAWLPRVKSINGVPIRWTDGDRLTVWPYRITRSEFVPGYPVKYSWEVNGTKTGNTELASTQIDKIKAFPNPYFGTSELEYNSPGEKFIYFSHLPGRCDIHIYTLDGVLVKKIERNQTDVTNTLEKWDLKNSEGRYVASGMYIIYIDCKNIGVRTLKIAVFSTEN